jgi:hypothetical protein
MRFKFTILEAEGDFSSAKNLLNQVDTRNPKQSKSENVASRIDRLEELVGEDQDPQNDAMATNAFVAVVLLLTAWQFGLFALETMGELAFIVGSIAGLYQGTTMLWKIHGKVSGILSLIASVAVLSQTTKLFLLF